MGNITTAPGRFIFQTVNTLVAKRLDEMRQTVNNTAINRNAGENFAFIQFFKWLLSHLASKPYKLSM